VSSTVTTKPNRYKEISKAGLKYQRATPHVNMKRDFKVGDETENMVSYLVYANIRKAKAVFLGIYIYYPQYKTPVVPIQQQSREFPIPILSNSIFRTKRHAKSTNNPKSPQWILKS
jgi:hypothetical protein